MQYLRLSLIPFLVSSSLIAAENGPTTLDDLTVTATPFASDLQESPSAVDLVSGDEKRRRQNASLGDLLDEIPGINSISTGSQVGKPVIRGLSGNRVRVLADGLGQDHQQDGVRHPPNVDPFLAERVEVVRGPMSVLYGSDALGGVINLIPRTIPSTASGKSLLEGRLTGSYASNNNEGMLGLEAEGARGGFGWTLALSERNAGNLTTPDEPTYAESGVRGDPKFSGQLDYTDFEITDGTLGLGYTGEAGSINFRVTHWNSEQNFLLTNGSVTGQNLKNNNFSLTGEYLTANDWLIKPTLGWQHNLRQAGTGVTYAELNGGNMTLDILTDRYNMKLAAEHPIVDGWQGEIGLEILEKEQDLRRGHLVPDAEQSSQSLYAFETAELGRLGLQLGARYDNVSLQAATDENYTAVDTREKEWSVWTGSTGASWALNQRWKLVGTLGRGFRTPSIFELYADGVHGGVAAYQRGNPELEAETSLNTDLGIRWQGDDLKLGLTLFNNDIDNYIYLANTGTIHTGSGLPIYQVEQEDARLRGVELSLSGSLTRWLEVEASYEAVSGELTSTDNELPLLPAKRLRAELRIHHNTWRGLRDLRGHLSANHAWAKDAAGPYEPFAQFDNIPFGTASTDAYTLWELGAGFDLPLKGNRSLEVDFRIENLFDTAYQDFLDSYKGYTLGAGRNLVLTLSLPLS
jgi:iron complex outermembrane receptor protein/hemoglobin/transferrin/lactoferrin receptor protein